MDFIKMIKSFKYAAKGLLVFFAFENNAKFHLLAAIGVIVLGNYYQIEKIEWLAILFCIVLVLTAEVFNTAIENICNKIQPKRDPDIAKIKDLAAAGVLLASAGAVIVALIIFFPRIFS